MTEELKVRTHVARDLLQTAQLFRSPEAAIWEYVVNSIEYVDRGVHPEVVVRIDRAAGEVVVADNGRGMDVAGLQHFFTMHAENPDRKRGKRGRGKFGTGKAAAFGIAKKLQVRTVRRGRRNVVELERKDIERSGGAEIPVRWVERDVPTQEPNGTVVTISKLLVPKISQEQVVRYIERQLPFFRQDPVVVVNGHRCEARRPQAVKTWTFRPTEEQRKLLGNVTLEVGVSAAPLDEGLYGVAVTTAPGALVAVETAGIEKKEFGTYLFGEVECPALEDERYELAPYDATRSLTLNPQHPVAAVLIGFIGASLEQVREALAEEFRHRRDEREFKELQRQADRIARILNEDLAEMRERFAELAALRRRGNVSRAGAQSAGEDPDTVAEGGEEPGILDEVEPPGEAEAAASGREAPDIARRGEPDPAGPDRVGPRGGEGGRRRARGGLRVEYRNLGEDKDRGLYDSAEKVVLINLDHPMVAAARDALGIDDPGFLRLGYEIAFTTYALGLARELLAKDPELTGDDVLFEVRDTLRRVTRRAAALYRKTVR
ncbi:MAG TPA: ATP-binding protein [Actinomycetota bacterium]|nr:ATP-binding protein [Actinomycetota bacterium]